MDFFLRLRTFTDSGGRLPDRVRNVADACPMNRTERTVRRDRVLAVVVPLEGVILDQYTVWADRWKRSGLPARAARLYAPWYPATEDRWRQRAERAGFQLSRHYPHDIGCCGGADELRHVGDVDGTTYRLVVEEQPRLVLRARFCRFGMTETEADRIDRWARKSVADLPRPSAAQVARVTAIIRSATEEMQRAWDRTPVAVPEPLKDKREREVQRLRAQAERLGMDLVHRTERAE